MTEFSIKNKGPLTFLIVIICALIMVIDGWLEKDTNTTVQWVVFALGVISLMYIHLMAGAGDIEYEEEYIEPNIVDISKMSLQEQVAHELEFAEKVKNGELKLMRAGEEELVGVLDKNDGHYNENNYKLKDNPDKEKTIFIVQPITVTQEELKEKIEELTNNNETNNIDMETKDTKSLGDGPQINTVINYSLHNIHKKHRGLYADIAEFATKGTKKTEAELTAKLRSWGLEFTVDKPKSYALAFDVKSEPKLRIPESGYFAIKA